MAKVDIVTLGIIMAVDGTPIQANAIIKFNSEFQIRSNDVMIRPKIYRSRELFESGFEDIRSNQVPSEFVIKLTEEDFTTLTPLNLYYKVKDYLNTYAIGGMFDVIISN